MAPLILRIIKCSICNIYAKERENKLKICPTCELHINVVTKYFKVKDILDREKKLKNMYYFLLKIKLAYQGVTINEKP